MPSSFAASRTVKKAAFTAPAGWQMFPNVVQSFVQSDAICKPQARNARVGVQAQRMIGATTNCSQFGNGFSCNSDLSGMQGFANTVRKNRAETDSYNSCMAQYGWKNNNKSNLIESLFGR